MSISLLTTSFGGVSGIHVTVSVVVCFLGVLKLNFLAGLGGVCVGNGTKLVPCAV